MTSSSAADSGAASGPPAANPRATRAERPSIAQTLLPYWLSREKWLALSLLAIILGISFSGTYTAVYLNRLSADVTDAMIALDWPRLKPLLLLSLTVGAVGVLLPHVAAYVSGYLELRWRTWMTQRSLERWMSSAQYYSVERDDFVSNADQRIAEDLRLVADQSLNLFTSVVGVSVSVATFTLVLWNVSGSLAFTLFGREFSVPGYLVFAAYGYSILHLALSHWLGKRLIGLNMHRQTVEADFRYHGMQVREYAEQIAFYRGGARETGCLNQAFERIRHNTLAILKRTFATLFGQSLYGHVFSVLPTLLVLPRLLAGEVTFGQMTMIVGAYGMLTSALAFFTQAYIGFTNWLALTNRVRDLHWGFSKAEQQSSQVERLDSEDGGLGCRDLQLSTPLGQPLAPLASWWVKPGERWIIKGPSGAGKSTLLRCCAGLWPYGEGRLWLPRERRSLFLPQKSYIPSGTLREALAYPQDGDSFSEEQYRQALHDVRLGKLADSLSINDRWQQTLSGGEQQRLAFARALLQRPDYLFLDEATSALDLDSEHLLYGRLLERLPDSTLISVAHRPSVDEFHAHVLDLAAKNSG